MDLIYYADILRRRWILVALSVGLAVGMATLVTARMTARYAASITFMVSAPTNPGDGASAYNAFLLSQQRVKSYADLLRSRRVAEGIAAALHDGSTADDLRGRISARAVPDTVLIQATVTDPSPERAQRLATVLGAQFTRFIDDAERPAPGKDPGVRITVTDDPPLPSRPVSPRPLLNLAIAALVGLVTGTVGAVLRENSDTSVRSRKVLREATGSVTLGVICHDRGAGRRPLIACSGADSPAAEAFRSLRTVLQFADGGRLPASLAITSSVAREGKSTVACNLAVTLAEAGWRVVLVDADLRAPRAAGHLGADGSVGLSDVLRGNARLDDAIQECGPGALSVLPGGPVPPNPSELLASEEMRWVLGELRERADIVLVDTPALLPVTDAAILAKACAGTVLVTRYGRTRREQVVRAVEQLRAVDVTLLGTVLNGVPAGEPDADRGAPRRTAAARPGVAAGRP